MEPHEGPLGARLLRVMGRFFDFVDEHGPGFSALMRGGPAVGSSTANAMIDEVRDAAYLQILAHLGVEHPPARLELVWTLFWVSLAESTALIWLDGRRNPRAASWSCSWCTTSRSLLLVQRRLLPADGRDRAAHAGGRARRRPVRRAGGPARRPAPAGTRTARGLSPAA